MTTGGFWTIVISWHRPVTCRSFLAAVRLAASGDSWKSPAQAKKNVSSIHYYALSISLGAPPLKPHRHTSDLIKLQPQSGEYDLNQTMAKLYVAQ